MGTAATPSSTEHVFERAGAQIHVWLTGPAEGAPIVFTHGASMDHRMFDEQLHPLVAAGYRVITWDIRGHGRSQPLGHTPIRVSDMTEDLLAILDQLGIRGPICVAGQSLGGYVAQELVYRAPERVAAIAIIGSTCITMPIPWWEQWALRSSPWWFVPWPWSHLKRTVARSLAQCEPGQSGGLQPDPAGVPGRALPRWQPRTTSGVSNPPRGLSRWS